MTLTTGMFMSVARSLTVTNSVTFSTFSLAQCGLEARLVPVLLGFLVLLGVASSLTAAFLLRRLLDIGAGLGDIDLLRALAYALALLRGALELAEVNLADHLEPYSVVLLLRLLHLLRGGCRSRLHLFRSFGGRGLIPAFLRLGSFRFRIRLILVVRPGDCGLVRCRGLFLHGRLLRLGFLFHGHLGLRLLLGFGRQPYLQLGRFGHGLLLNLGLGLGRLLRLLLLEEGIALDDGLVLGFVLLLGFLAALLVALLDYLGDLDIDLVGGLLELHVLTELPSDSRKQLVRHLGVRVRLHLDTLLVEELHEDVETDIVLSDDLA